MKKILLILLCVNHINIHGQTELDSVTITASITQSKISDSGRDIIVISGSAFNNLPVHSLDELLRYVPGIEVQQRGPQGSQSDILIRGGTFQQVLVIIDGIRLNDPLTGHFNSYIPVTPAEIDRIEIMKGASSAIYGSDAVGGIIHIITKTFSSRLQKNKFGTTVALGNYGLFNLQAGGNYQKDNLAMSAGLLSNNARGQEQRGIKGYFHNTTTSGSVRYRFNDWQIGFQSSYDKRNFAAQNFYTVFTSDTATEKVSTWWNHIRISHSKNKNQFSFDAGYKKVTDQYFFNKNATPNLNKSTVIQSVAVYAREFDPKTKLVVGSQLINRSIKSNDRGNHSVNSFAGFIILNRKLGANFNISPALRVEKGLIPQVNMSYRIKKLLLRASGGKTIRDADFTERYNNYGKPLVSSGNIGDAGLSSESSWSWEAGADYFPGPSIKLSSGFFAKYYSDLIDWVNTPYAEMPRKDNLSPTGNYFLAKNISQLVTSGIELSAQYQSKVLNSQIGLTIINSSATPSLYISSHANLLVNFSIQYRYKFILISVNGLYKQRQAEKGNATLTTLTKEYFLTNSKLSLFVKKQNIFIQCDNIGNISYADRFGVAMPGRWWSLGLQWEM